MSAVNIFIDAVIYQIQQGRPAGISRVWTALLNELARSPLAERVLLLERGGYRANIPGLRSISIREFNPLFHSAEPLYLQNVLNAEGGGMLLTTYYTCAENSPSVLVLHDMTPEVMAFDLGHPEWQAKSNAIEKASAYLSVSHSTRNDFYKIYPQHASKPLFVVPNAVSDEFRPNSAEEIQRFKRMYGLHKPYFIICGHRLGYKNALLFFRAFALLENRGEFEILCTGGAKELESLFAPYIKDVKTQVQFFTDHELTLAFSGAQALVYPSLYEGFGLPILEAMKSGCPVITCKHSSIPEVAGEAALSVDGYDTLAMKRALETVQSPETHAALAAAGLVNAKRFSWQRSGELFISALSQIANRLPEFPIHLTAALNTGIRLVQSLLLSPATKSLASSLFESILWHNGQGMSVDFSEIERIEAAICGRMDAASQALIEKMSWLPDSDGFIHYWRGLLLEAEGKSEEALAAHEKATRRNLTSTRLVHHMARLATDTGKPIYAAKYYEILLKGNPNFAEAKDRLKTIGEAQARLRESMQLFPIAAPPAPPVADGGAAQPGEIAVSVILPSKDRPDGLEDALASLPAAMGGLSYEVILYLGGGENALANDIVAKHGVARVFHDNQVFTSGEKFSWSKLMNHGVQQARGRWVIYASDDVVFHPLAFARALALAENNGQPWGGVSFLHRNTVEDYGGVFKDYGYDRVGGKTFINFGLVNRQAFAQTDGFDEGYKFYWADVDLCLQLWRAGYTIGVSPHSLVEHNNLVDKFRVENSGDRYFADTQYYFDKWQGSPILHPGGVLAKERFVLRPNGNGASGLDAERPAGVTTQSAVTSYPPPFPLREGGPGGIGEPLVSAIVSTYNAAKFLRGCLDDLEAQTIASQLEIIVVNSGSEQDEEKIVRDYQRRYPNIVYLHTAERESVYAAWNRAIQVARGKYLTNANSDDRHHPTAFARLAAALEADPGLGVVYADCAVTQKPNTTLTAGPIAGRFRWPDFDRRLLFQVCFVGPQPMWRKSLHAQHGLFDPGLSSAGDYEFWLRISDHNRFLHLPAILGVYLEHASSIEHKSPQQAVREAEAARQRHWQLDHGPRPAPGGNFLERYTPNGAALPRERYPLVSVIVPTFNRPAGLRAALSSIHAQTYPNIEIIVVNDAGEDVQPLIAAVKSHRPIRCETHATNQGAGAARNTAMRLARGKYIAFLDDDDLYRPEHIFALVAELEAQPGCVAAYSDAEQAVVEENGKITTVLERRIQYSVDFSRDELLVRNYIPNLCLVFRRAALDQAGDFDASMAALEDWEWLTRLARVGDFSHLPITTAEYKVRPRARSRNMLRPAQIRALYVHVYGENRAFASSDVRARQREFYRSMTGRDLEADLPPNLAEAPALPLAESAAATLEAILNADDLGAALDARRAELTPELLALVQTNASAARQDGETELAEGLDALGEYIRELAVASNQGRN